VRKPVSVYSVFCIAMHLSPQPATLRCRLVDAPHRPAVMWTTIPVCHSSRRSVGRSRTTFPVRHGIHIAAVWSAYQHNHFASCQTPCHRPAPPSTYTSFQRTRVSRNPLLGVAFRHSICIEKDVRPWPPSRLPVTGASVQPWACRGARHMARPNPIAWTAYPTVDVHLSFGLAGATFPSGHHVVVRSL
jgi:hypothetical protein